ncbi:MAG: spermidine synthase [Gemmatimonadetes bacterium]|nr:spermidine synthase [Gemmatimonadota bacterium]
MWWYFLLVFMSGACIMTIELVAARLIAPYVGVSLYTWTSIIGVLLGGMSGGYFLGGVLADRLNPRRLLPWTLLLAAASTCSILLFLTPVMTRAVPKTVYPLVAVVVPVVLLFLVPAVFLALIAPVVYKLALEDLRRTGRTVGRLAAGQALGSIAGTFATGFWLVPAFGTRTIVLGVAGGLAVLGVLTVPLRPASRGAVLGLLLASLVMAAWQRPALLRSSCQWESSYFCIRINTVNDGNRTVKQLELDWLVHSAADPQDPGYFWYDYEAMIAWLILQHAPPDARSLFLGGGGYTLPHWMARHLPATSVEVAEIDPLVTAVAYREFIPQETRIVTYNRDARLVLRDLPPGARYDIIVGDVFNDISVPYHLTTLEFSEEIRDRLAPDGLYLVNAVDWLDGRFLGAFSQTLQRVFPHVYVLDGDRNVDRRNWNTFIIVAAKKPIPWDTWLARPDVPFRPGIYPPRESPLILSDDYAPVDNLLLGVVATRWRE